MRLRRALCVLAWTFCVLFVADSASWAATAPRAGSASWSQSWSSAGAFSMEEEPPPEEPSPTEPSSAAGTEEDPMIVQLQVEQMALLLLWACLTSVAAAVVTVRSLR